ncbi:MAG: exopolysaccharide biosynthesis glycosyltransferase VpsK [Calditrichia bacterium]
MNRVDFLGFQLDNLSMSETISKIGKIIEQRKPVQHVVLNAAKIVQAVGSPSLRETINSCGLINADGQAVVWAARLLGIPLKERVAGVDLMYEIMKYAPQKGWRIFFLGAKEEVVQAVVHRAKKEFPGINIAGFRNGYFTDDEEAVLVEQIASSKPDILFVGISSPKKEIFLNKYLDKLNVPFCMGVGGSFDVFAGIVKRAPKILQKMGMEWFYRVIQEPRRMWKRYAKTNPIFIYLVLRAVLRKKGI